MENPDSLEGYIFLKWLDEDDDNMNLVISDARRQGIEACMAGYLAKLPAAGKDELGNALYSINQLDEAFAACFVPPPPDSSPA
jgi:hypothetical protein